LVPLYVRRNFQHHDDEQERDRPDEQTA